MSVRSSPPIEGVIEGVLLWSGRPVVDAQITACRDLGYDIHRNGSCKQPVETRTDTQGRFLFRQLTGIAPFDKAERDEFRSKGMSMDPGWSYGFRVDYNGVSALHFDHSLGFGPTRVQLRCDLSPFLARMKLEGIRPVANPANMPYMECTANRETLEVQ